MKAILKFDLSDPDDTYEFESASNAGNLRLALWDIDQYLREQMKYNDSITDDGYKELEKTRDKLHEIMDDYGITKIVNK